MTWILGALLTVAAVVLLVRRKLHGDGIYQGGTYVGSALLAEAVYPDADRAAFLVVRGMPAFQPDQPFKHRRRRYLLVSFERCDESSTVLRRYMRASCEILAPAPGARRT